MVNPFRRKKKHGPVELEVVNVANEDVMSDIVRVDISHRPFSRAGQVIVVRHGSKKVRLVARGPTGVKKHQIRLDSATRRVLGVAPGQTASLEFHEAGWWDGLVWAWHATDAMPRVAARLGVVSVALGFVGAALGAWSLFLTLAPTISKPCGG